MCPFYMAVLTETRIFSENITLSFTFLTIIVLVGLIEYIGPLLETVRVSSCLSCNMDNLEGTVVLVFGT